MKTRVLKCGSSYYPQHKGWFSWGYYYNLFDMKFSFKSVEEAVEWLQQHEAVKDEEVVWESK